MDSVRISNDMLSFEHRNKTFMWCRVRTFENSDLKRAVFSFSLLFLILVLYLQHGFNLEKKSIKLYRSNTFDQSKTKYKHKQSNKVTITKNHKKYNTKQIAMHICI